MSQILKELTSTEIQDPQHKTYMFASWEKVHGWSTNLDRQSEWLQSVVSSRVFREWSVNNGGLVVPTKRNELEYVPTVWGAAPTVMLLLLLLVVDDFVSSLKQYY